MKRLLLTIMFFAGVYGLSFSQQGSQSQSKASANDPNWEKIGEKTVDLNSDKGIFDWNTDREKTVNANEKYSAIKFKAKDATVDLTNVQVEYDNGQKQDLSVNSPVKANSESKVLTLNNQSELDKITFNFKKDASGSADKAKIEVWGLKSKSSSGMGQRSTDQTTNQSSSSSDKSKSGMGSSRQSSSSDQSSTGTKKK